MKDNLLKIITHFGVRHQIKKLSEEVFELQEAIIDAEYNRYVGVIRKPGERVIEHIEEEFADCMVLLEQIQEFYNLREEKIKDIMEYKVNRTLERIEKSDK